jgi:hypothetical protein
VSAINCHKIKEEAEEDKKRKDTQIEMLQSNLTLLTSELDDVKSKRAPTYVTNTGTSDESNSLRTELINLRAEMTHVKRTEDEIRREAYPCKYVVGPLQVKIQRSRSLENYISIQRSRDSFVAR